MLLGRGTPTSKRSCRVYSALLQSYIWQEYDLAPRFPKLRNFLDFWTAKLDGKLFKVTVAHSQLIRPAELRMIGAELKIH